MSRAVQVASVILALCALTNDVEAQDSRNSGKVGKRKTLPLVQEIALARSAAPASVSDSATIWAFTDSGYVIASKGSNGAACYVSRSWPASIEPHCFDAEGAATVMRLHMREVELWHKGVSIEDVDKAIGADLATGKLRPPRRPSMSYMMSAGQQLISDEGQAAGAWRPHIMIYYPYLESSDLYKGTPDVNAGMVTGAGTATSSIMIVVPSFVKVREPVP
jgi:hypothetical protein